jgi:hypothetical protein
MQTATRIGFSLFAASGYGREAVPEAAVELLIVADTPLGRRAFRATNTTK